MAVLSVFSGALRPRWPEGSGLLCQSHSKDLSFSFLRGHVSWIVKPVAEDEKEQAALDVGSPENSVSGEKLGGLHFQAPC